MRSTIGRKLGFGIGVLLLPFIVSGFFSYLQTRFIDGKIRDITELKEPISAAAYEMEINLIGTGFGLLGYLHDHDPNHIVHMKKNEELFEIFQENYHRLADTQIHRQLGGRLDEGYNRFRKAAEELIRVEVEQTAKLNQLMEALDEIGEALEKEIPSSIDEKDGRASAKQYRISQMEVNANGTAKAMGMYLKTHQEKYKDQLQENRDAFRRHHLAFNRMPLSDREKDWADAILQLYLMSTQLIEEIIAFDKTKGQGLSEFVKIRRQLDSILSKGIKSEIEKDLIRAKQDAHLTADRANALILSMIFISLAAGIFVGWITTTSVTGPVSRLIAVTNRLAKGDFSKKIVVTSEDELGILAESFNRMSENLQRTMISRNYVERIIQSLNESLMVVSPGGRIQTVNPAICRLLGYEKWELVGQPFDMVFSEDQQTPAMDTLMEKEVLSGIEQTYLAKDGRNIPVRFTSAVMLHKNNKVQGIVCAAYDVTEIKHAEEALRKSEAKLAEIVNSVSDHIIMVDEELNIVWANAISSQLFGPDLVGRKCYSFYSPTGKPCETCLVEQCLKDGKSHEQEMQFEAADGKRMDFWAIAGVAETYADGRPKMVVEVFRNITERKTSQAETMRAAHLASIGELAAGVAHEINNPINSTINLAQILVNESDQDSLTFDIAKRIRSEGERIASIVTSLLSFARERKENKAPVDLHEIILETLALTESQLEKDCIVLKLEIPDDLPEIIAHPQQIQQVFMNLVSNARYALEQKYPGEHEEKILAIRGEEKTVLEKKYVRVVFTDTGMGIPPNILEKVMDPFFSSKPVGMGTGLGLSISHGIISDHGGRLKIESVEGEFTKILIDIPVRAAEG